MTLTNLALWAQIIASLAVLGTVVYLAIQVKQNTTSLDAQTHATLFEGSQTELLSLYDHPEIIQSITKPGILSEHEYIRLSTFLTAFLRTREYTWHQHNHGIVHASQMETEKIIIRNTFGFGRNKTWWERVGKGAYGPQFCAFVDGVLREGGVYGEWYRRSLGWESDT